MKLNAGVLILLVLAGGYVVLAVYGKYRRLKKEFEEKRLESQAEREPPEV